MASVNISDGSGSESIGRGWDFDPIKPMQIELPTLEVAADRDELVQLTCAFAQALATNRASGIDHKYLGKIAAQAAIAAFEEIEEYRKQQEQKNEQST